MESGEFPRIRYHDLLPFPLFALGGTRTHDPGIRNPLLYPAELRAQKQRIEGWEG